MSGPTWDGLIGFLGGVLAFVAILIQVHFANKGVRSQLQAEKDARAQDGEARKRAVATAILFEVDQFYRWHVKAVIESLRNTPPNGLPHFGRIRKGGFPVYEANSGYLGYLPRETGAKIVEVYGMIEGFLNLLSNYSDVLSGSMEKNVAASAGQILQETLAELRRTAPQVEERIHEFCSELTNYIGDPRISIRDIPEGSAT